MVGGRTVEVDLALSQDDARNLASGGRTSSEPGKDNRALYLVPSSYTPLLALLPVFTCCCNISSNGSPLLAHCHKIGLHM